ncbi:MAG TPA: SDR family oxidoreductase [Mycobacteriales bacterium]|nr:SDR family oxidoreductase [Mycobacteriales bacterium]
MLLAGRRVLVTGVLTEASLASAVVRETRARGAEVLLTSPVCRAHRVTSRLAPRLGVDAPVLELDVELPDDLAALADAVREAGWDGVDGVVHAIAYLGDRHREPQPDPHRGDAGFAGAPWDAVAPALQTAAWSMAAVVHALRPLLTRGSSVVGLTLDPARARAGADWLPVARAGLAAVTRQLARELGPAGVRVNLVASGPARTMLSRALPETEALVADWAERAPLGWDADDRSAVARTVAALLSDLLPATTGELVHADGGRHAVE